MSRYEVEAENPDHTAVVGWDPPLQTFFLQVHARKIAAVNDNEGDDEDEGPVHWVGASRPGEIGSMEALLEAARGWVRLDETMLRRLEADMLASVHEIGPDRAREICERVTTAELMRCGLMTGRVPNLVGISLAEARAAVAIVRATPKAKAPDGSTIVQVCVADNLIAATLAWARIRTGLAVG